MNASDETGVYDRTRSQHLEWCKNRAYRYWREGHLVDAVTSMASDLEKHESFRAPPILICCCWGLCTPRVVTAKVCGAGSRGSDESKEKNQTQAVVREAS